jgi:hypothetical protein
MIRNSLIVAAAAVVIALPFVFQRESETESWAPGDPTVVIITPQNEAIRYEFARGFSRWHQERYGTPVRVEYRAVGGTSEIARYLTAELVTAFRAWYTLQGNAWPAAANAAVVDTKFDPDEPPAVPRREGESDDRYENRVNEAIEQWKQLGDIR